MLSERWKIRIIDSKMESLLGGNYHVLIFLALGPVAQEVRKLERVKKTFLFAFTLHLCVFCLKDIYWVGIQLGFILPDLRCLP